MVESKESITDAEKRLYEAAFHLVPTLGANELEEAVSVIRALIEGHGGSISSEHFPDSFTLAYPLFKREKGAKHEFQTSYFGWIIFEAPGEGADTIRLELKNVPAVLRHVVIKSAIDKKPTAPKRSVFERPIVTDKKEEKEVAPRPEKAEISDEALDRELEKLVAE